MKKPWAESQTLNPNENQQSFCTETTAAYGICLCGKSHEKTQTCVQDSYALVRLPNDWILLIAADGIGSEARAEMGSALASHAVANFVKTYWGYFLDSDSLLNLLRSAYQHASGVIARQALKEKRPIHEFGTTLHTALYANGMVYYGHAGDGGIITLNREGGYEALTQPQKGADHRAVVPLMAGPSYWEFGASKEAVQSVLVCTDGVFDKLYSRLRKSFDESTAVDKIIAGYFLSPFAFDYGQNKITEIQQEVSKVFRTAGPNDFYPKLVRVIAQGEDEEKAQQLLLDMLTQGYNPLRTLQSIMDDITVVAAVDFSIFPEVQPIEYYRGVDLIKLNQLVYEKLYGQTDKPTNAQNSDTTKDDLQIQE